ncbi:acetoacetate decarboxylase family protein [Dactylosporangium sp. AC04546]|uniref:acetoacetate decarboxylase family protein n=1 Tax=Dactylosporangium sp. AC04546 TaxID=2862460 RepID=UPI001EDE1B56|nr:acetoacetate decarboxylase family protein [Dactylosporangium sp. AC04546]WVK78416.1 acetoacetate decarboxylase family protein [Dactylosporangium sp. AC04546]
MAYPPEPWSLRGTMHVSVWVVPRSVVPPLPAGLRGAVRVVRLGGQAVVGTAWVDYQPGGDMSYRELLAATLTRSGARPRVTISHIWVDSPDSRDGGRELWGIPKDLADLTVTDVAATAETRSGPIASSAIRAGRLLPLRLPVAFRVAQDLAGAAKVTPVRSTARYGTARVAWDVAADGPLAFLSGRRPLLSMVATDFRMRFGDPARRPAADPATA